ncbi:MAG TPA: energy-coupling factor transporter transmembrane component T, partial [Solirubrobacteraceae bacterium]|nr:energy-coupling factor transporter transmembrane component T [Solirubrobacteraceae bacterium]
MSYLPRSSPLHAARASIAAAYCAALILAALLTHQPLILGALGLATALAAAGAGVGRRVARSLYFSVPMLLLVVVVNSLISRNGLTVLARFGDWGPLGQVDPTLEAVCYGAVIGLELAVIVAVCALASATVDPDEVLRSLRRVSFSSALTATLATRMVPLLAADAQRIGEAQRSRIHGASRAAIMRAITTNALDRALDVAATLEVRGYGAARRPPRVGRPVSRHDLAFGFASGLIAVLAFLVLVLHLAAFRFYPMVVGRFGVTQLLVAGGFVVLALAPFLE